MADLWWQGRGSDRGRCRFRGYTGSAERGDEVVHRGLSIVVCMEAVSSCEDRMAG